MRIYFFSSTPCVFRFASVYTAKTGIFPVYAEAEADDSLCLTAEFFPQSPDLSAQVCVIHPSFFVSPPYWAEVYRGDGFYAVYAKRFPSAKKRRKRIVRAEENGVTAEIDESGTVTVSQKASFTTDTLPVAIEDAEIRFLRNLIFIQGGGLLAVYAPNGKRLFFAQADEFDFTDKLRTKTVLANHIQTALCQTYTLTEEGFSRTECKAEAKLITDGRLLLFALAEAWLTACDYTPYLSDSLLPKAEMLSAYLGNAVKVAPCLQAERENEQSVALCYREAENVYAVRILHAQIRDGKIENLSLD